MQNKFLFIVIPFCAMYAQPENPNIIQGNAKLVQSHSTLTIHAADATVIDWKNFSIAEGEITRFILPSEQAKILNRVTGKSISEIWGSLDSNGKFYLINPNGILFGPNAVINTKTALFSTLELCNDDFLSGDELHFIGKEPSKIVNYGKIHSNEDLILVSRVIENNGTIGGKGKSSLVAACEVLIKPMNDSFYIRPLAGDGEIINRGNIESLQISLQTVSNPYSLAISQEPSSYSVVEEGGRIYLREGTLSAEKIEVRANRIEVGVNTHLSADGRENGGSIFVIAEDLLFQGSASALGGVHGGDGGFIEISGHRSFIYHPKYVSTLAPHGKTGTLLLDPNDIIIQLAMPTSGGFSNPYSGATFQPAYLQISDLVGASGLLNNDVVVQTDVATGGGSGDITIQDPFLWSTPHQLTLLPFRDLNVNALAQSTGLGSITVTAGRHINIGTSVSLVPSALKVGSGNLTLTAAQDLILMGGSGLDAYAECSSILGTITCSIGRNLTLLGGNGSGAYAQIGKGVVTGSTAISSPITFTSLVGDVTLTGGAMGSGAYAQIGHAPNGPGNHSVTSNINFPDVGTNGLLALTGDSINCSAIIGHGNEVTPNLNSASGAINVFVSNGAILQGGGSSGSHAVIGFQDPNGGSAGTFTCNSTGVSVQNFIMNDITLNAGTGSNAVIGYYNNSIIGAGPNLTITLVDVEVPINLNVNLNAGASGAINNGVAAIGTLANVGTAQSGIKIVTGTLNLNTAPPLGDGSARIMNCLPTSSVPFDVNINCGGVGPVATLLGGITSPLNFAEIYSGRNLIFNFGGDLIVNQTTQRGFAQVRAYSTVSLNPSTFGGSINLQGSSTNTTGYALIQALNGPVQFGTQFLSGGTDVNLGDITSVASSKIVSETGASIFNTAGGDFTLQGGTGVALPTAEISNNLGTIVINGKDMTLTGGSGVLAYAQIASNLGNVTTTLSHNLLLQGGTAVQAYAQIGKGYITTETSIQSSLLFPSISGSVQILGGTATGAYAQIGHSPFNNIAPIDVTGNIDFTPTGINNFLTLRGGTAIDATAILGFGNELSTQVSSYTSNIINLLVSNNILLQADPGLTLRTHAIIGFHSPTTVVASPLIITSNNPGIFVKSISGSITGNAENGSNATIGYYNSTNLGSVNATVEQITVQANSTITFQAGNDNGTGAGVAAIGTFVANGSIAHSNIEVDGTTVSLLGPTGGVGGNDGSARIVNHFLDFGMNLFPSAPFDIVMNVTDLLVYGGTGAVTGFADVYSSQDLTVNFSNNFEVNASAPLQNGYAHIIAHDDIAMGSIGNLVSVIGGAFFSADARIESINGNISHGNFQSGGAFTINIGQANSLSTSQVITHIGTNSINSSSNFSIQGGAGMDCVSLVRTDSGSFFVSAGSSMTITGGTGGDFASAEIRSLSGSGQVAAASNLTLLGGGNTLCFAQINSDTGSITFPNIGNNLLLTGGPGTQSYAQIGKGYVASATFINSNLTFFNIGNNATLTGSATGTDSYAQIGHSPFFSAFAPPIAMPINVQGNVTLSNIGGKLTLNGGLGPAANTTAIIGHGNELTGFIANCIGSITVHDSGINGIELNPGAPLLNTHAVIGFHSPAIHPANMVTFHVVSPLVDVETSFGPIAVNGGDRENAIIGYYNQTTPILMPPGVDVTISNLTVKCAMAPLATNNITLQAGNNAGTGNGVAIIGTDVAIGNSAVSTIQIQGNILNLFGPTGANNGEALVTNNRIGASNPLNVTINTNTTTVFGGTGATTGLAEIYSSDTLNCNFKTTLNVGVNPALPGVLSNAPSLVRAFSSVLLNQAGSTGIINLVGGATPPIGNDISSFAGAVMIGDSNAVAGASNINIGTSMMVGSARIFTVTGDVFAQISGNATLIGGLNNAAVAEMSANANMTLNAAGSVSLLGGSAPSAVARISSSDGKNNVFGNTGVTLNGGVALAEIRNFGFQNKSLIVQSNADITINANARVLNDGGGNTNVVAGNNLVMNGDGLIQNIKNGPLLTFSGVSTFLNDTARIEASGGDLSIVVDNDFPTPPGIGPGRFVSAPGVAILSLSRVRIFTATRPQNSIQSLVNGFPFVPGIEFVDTSTEKWKTYFFSSFGGAPFTIFYKDFIPVNPVVPIIINSYSSVLFAQDLRTYDNLIMETHPMFAAYHYCENKMKHCLDTTDWYRFWRQLYRNYNMKILDPLD